MYVLSAIIEVGGFVFRTIHDISITKSVELISDTAIIKLPTSFKVKDSNELKYTEQVVNIGDPIKITLAYKNVYEGIEFVGYVSKISPKYPLEIHCEDAIWLLKRKNNNKAWNKSVFLKDILEEICKGTGIKVSDKSVDFELDKYLINNANGAQVLQHLKQNMGMTAFLDDKGELYCGLEQGTNLFETVVYDLNYNIVENKLEFQTKEEKNIRVKYVYISPQNKRTIVEVGDLGGELKTYHTTIVSDVKKLEQMAVAEMAKLKYDGFRGSLKSFLVPYATRGMKASVVYEKYSNRTGSYFIKKVVTTFTRDGARRNVTLGARL